jgi:hypothetical protein
MPLLTCPHGHQWELAGDPRAETIVWPVPCPVCGAPVNSPEGAETQVGPTPTAEPLPPTKTFPPPGAPPTEHPVIPGYEILAELGRGGMGVVYKALHMRLDRQVAIKMLPPEDSADPAFAERFTREARALARLSHPHIITIHDFGQTDGGHSFFVMEYVEGSNLRGRLRAGKLEPAEALRLAVQVCDALAYAHEAGIVHRDIKPENILLDRGGRVKVADFGLAKLLTRASGEHSLTGPWQVMGTLHYMAPEQMTSPQNLDHRADIYSLGVVLYEMLTGQLPLGRFLPPSHRAGVDPRLDDIVLKALENAPERRFQQVSELKAALEALAAPVSGAALTAGQVPTADWPGRAGSGVPTTALVPPGQVTAIGGPDDIHRRVNRAAMALRVTGIIAFVPPGVLALVWLVAPLATGTAEMRRLEWFLTIAVGLISPLAGSLMLWGALEMPRLRSYGLARLGSVVALVWGSFLYVVGAGLGLWPLLVLMRPEVKAAFEARVEQAGADEPGPWQRFLNTPADWAILFCLLGVLALQVLVLPWADLQVQTGGGAYALVEFHGFDWWLGFVPLLFVLGLLLLLLTKGFGQRIAFWQPALLLLVGFWLLVAAYTFLRSLGWPPPHVSQLGFLPGREGAQGTHGAISVYLFRDEGTTLLYQLEPRSEQTIQATFEVNGRRRVGATLPVRPGSSGSPSDLLQRSLRLGSRPGAYLALLFGGGLVFLGYVQVRGWRRRRRVKKAT